MKLLLGCALAALLLLAAPLRADDDQHYLNNGYALLYKLCDQETQVDLILLVKTTPKEIADYAHEVARAAKEDKARLEDLRDHDHAINLNNRGLCQFELDTRDSIKGDKQHMLLFGTKDNAFVRAFLVTQVEAGTYGMNLAKVLADHESSTHRAAVDRKISADWQKLRDKAYRLLNAT